MSSTTSKCALLNNDVSVDNILPILRELSSNLVEENKHCSNLTKRIQNILPLIKSLCQAGWEVEQMETIIDQCQKTNRYALTSIEAKTAFILKLNALAARVERVTTTDYACRGQETGDRRRLVRDVNVEMALIQKHLRDDTGRCDMFDMTDLRIMQTVKIAEEWSAHLKTQIEERAQTTTQEILV
jgi:hypothetical protein